MGAEAATEKLVMTALEKAMLDKGFVSARMMAAKTRRHVATIQRGLRLGEIAHREVNAQRFIALDEVKRYVGGGAAELLDVSDWSDVVEDAPAPAGGAPAEGKRAGAKRGR